MRPCRRACRTALSTGGCLLYWLHVGSLRPAHDRLLRAADLRRRAKLARVEDQRRFTAGRVLTYAALESLLGLPAGAVELETACRRCQRSDAKPRLSPHLGGAGVDFSIAHDGDLAVLAIARQAMVGADLEGQQRRIMDAGLARRFLHPDELADGGHSRSRMLAGHALTYWVRKESLVKATGEGLRAGLEQIMVTAPDVSPRLLRWAGHDHLIAGSQMWQTQLPGGYLAVVSLLPLGPRTRSPSPTRDLDVRRGNCLVDAALDRHEPRGGHPVPRPPLVSSDADRTR